MSMRRAGCASCGVGNSRGCDDPGAEGGHPSLGAGDNLSWKGHHALVIVDDFKRQHGTFDNLTV